MSFTPFLTTDAFSRGAMNGKLLDVLSAVNGAWTKLTEYSKAGSYTWTAPDLLGDGRSYKIGVLVIGGGGSGGAAVHASSSSVTNTCASGGASGRAISFELIVTPGVAYPIVVGSGGSKVTMEISQLTYKVSKGNNGGSSSFAGKVAEGGGGGNFAGANFGGNAAPGAEGGQCSRQIYVSTDLTEAAPFGGVIEGSTDGVGSLFGYTPFYCFNPFERKRILGAGAGAAVRYPGSFSVELPSIDPATNEQAGGSGSGSYYGSVSAGDGKQSGCGGGAAAVSMKTASVAGLRAVSGAGADGAVYIYVQGVAS